ncbi:MAG: L-arabinose isomerase [Flavobacteriales bacterium]|jgi:L-arabinose isomerase|nr:L-arabinose isomerase [Flavobacteriaceae bacterium]|tara:strand:- start:342 stop:1826 length:1485 start_codon:yes stop_codon:yes gene_type:complete
MKELLNKKIWFLTGTQHLYGQEALAQVSDNAKKVIEGLNNSQHIPFEIVYQPILKTQEEITRVCAEASSNEDCIGVIAWMHTFSPAKMWINGLKKLQLPLLHLHTQFNKEIPWSTINMDFMNLNQSAHGDREFGHILTRLGIKRKTVVGHWQNETIQQSIGYWMRAALGYYEMQNLKVCRFGDNMREVAVTEGDKVEAQIQFGFSVNSLDPSDIVREIKTLSSKEVTSLLKEYEESYTLENQLKEGGDMRQSLYDAAEIELALRRILERGNFKAFTDTFENLGELKQLPGIAAQRLMADGYGFGGEGDWKTAALTRVLKVMSIGLKGGTSFMEDYTYHFNEKRSLVLGSHMLEICPSIAEKQPSCEIHPLGIGGKQDPVRLVFNAPAGEAINLTLVDLGNRFRFILNEVDALPITEVLPQLPVARVLWDCKPNLETATKAWMLAGGAHHTVFSQALNTETIEDLAEMTNIELLVIDQNTELRNFKVTMAALNQQ